MNGRESVVRVARRIFRVILPERLCQDGAEIVQAGEARGREVGHVRARTHREKEEAELARP